MSFRKYFYLIVLLVSPIIHANEKVDFYLNKIKPLLKSECYKCHSHESGKSKGGLMLDSVRSMLKGGGSGPAVIPGSPQKSLLVQTVKRLDEDEAMPPKKELTKAQIALFEKWIQDGAHGPKSEVGEDKTLEKRAEELWSFQPVRNYAGSNPGYIDGFIDAKIKSKGLSPLGKADPVHLIRRVYFDLIGLPPNPEEVQEYLKNPDKNNFTKIVDDLLSRPQFGERWGRHWLDTARYAECNGGDRTHVFHQAWKYRNWVIDALNEDLPYDDFLIQQIAGDLLPVKTEEQKTKQMIATGFLAIGSKPLANRENEIEEKKLEMFLDPIDAVTMGTLGLSVGCAKCHDHKFDPIPTTDYYALAGIFKSTKLWYGPTFGYLPLLKDGGFEAHTHLIDPNLYTPDQKKLKEFEPIQKKHWDLAWAHKKMVGRTKFLANQLKRNIPADKKAEFEKELKQLEADIIKKAAELKDFEKNNKPNIEQIMAATDSKPANVKVRYAGDFSNVGPEVPRGFMSLLNVPGADLKVPTNGSGRLQLAKWIGNKKNPLSARVEVNRIWYHLFGRGIVESLDNLGFSGSKPTHPKLLDSLAYQFMNDFKWSRKAMIRQIVLSEAYQRSAVVEKSNANMKTDPLNHYLWRMTARRLEAEVIRDSMLSVCRRLNSQRPKRSIVERFKYSVNGNLDGGMAKTAAREIYGNHRTIYVPVFRLAHNRLLDLFDYPDDETVNSQRSSNVFATQGLFLMNNKLVTECAERFAWQILRDKSLNDDQARLNKAYMMAYSRLPLSSEVRKDLEFLKVMGEGNKGAWESLCQSLLVSSEFLYRF